MWYLIALIPDICTLTYFALALGYFANISYLEENFKPRLFERCLHYVLLGVSVWQPVTYVTISNFEK